MNTYKRNGRAHMALEYLARSGAAIMSEIRVGTGQVQGTPDGRAMWYAIGALLDDGLIARAGKAYVITDDGAALLEDLRLGVAQMEAKPSVRVFAREVAA